MISKVTELRIVSAAFALLALLFVAFPQIDIAVSRIFYEGNWQGPVLDAPLRDLAYRAVPRLGQGLLLALVVLFGVGFSKRFPGLARKRVAVGFLLASAVIGPLLVVDFTLKGHFGRARPAQVQEFGGSRQFSPAFLPVDQCPRNCSFVSGHVATAAFVMAFGWLGAPAVRRRWLAAGIACAAYLAWTRMTAGGHFLSDTIFAWFATYFSLWLTELLFRRCGWLPPEAGGRGSEPAQGS